MKMRLLTVISITLLSFIGLSAQDLSVGIDYFKAGEVDVAKEIITKNINSDPAVAYYFLGEIEYAEGKVEQARNYYSKGLEADATNPLNEIGLAKLMLKENRKEAVDKITAISKNKAHRKNADLLVEIATMYYENNMEPEARAMMTNAEKANRRASSLSILRGDMQKDKEQIGAAAADYEQAIMNDASLVVPNIKLAQLYLKVNTPYAIEKLEAVKELSPNHPLVDKYMAKAYYQRGQYDKAIEIYEDYFDTKGLGRSDDLTNYAASLFFTEKFEQASKLIDEGLKVDPDNFVFNRLSMYSALETENEKGLQFADRFFAIPLGDNEYIIRDYTTYGQLLLGAGERERALEAFEKGIALGDNLAVIANTCHQAIDCLAKAGAYEDAANFYQKYIDAIKEQATGGDYFQMGSHLYRAIGVLSRDTVDVNAPEKVKELIERADKAFATVTEMSPESHLGPLFRARTNAFRDPETTKGYAKPYYQQLIDVILAKDESERSNYSRELVEACVYFSYYYYVKFEDEGDKSAKDLSIEYASKILEIVPGHPQAQQIYDALISQ